MTLNCKTYKLRCAIQYDFLKETKQMAESAHPVCDIPGTLEGGLLGIILLVQLSVFP